MTVYKITGSHLTNMLPRALEKAFALFSFSFSSMKVALAQAIDQYLE